MAVQIRAKTTSFWSSNRGRSRLSVTSLVTSPSLTPRVRRVAAAWPSTSAWSICRACGRHPHTRALTRFPSFGHLPRRSPFPPSPPSQATPAALAPSFSGRENQRDDARYSSLSFSLHTFAIHRLASEHDGISPIAVRNDRHHPPVRFVFSREPPAFNLDPAAR